VIKGGRANVAIGKTEISMVENVEELSPELNFLGLRHSKVLKRGQVPICVSWPQRDVAACCAKLLYRRVGIKDDLLKCIIVEPCAGCMWPGVGILPGGQVRSVGRESGDLRRSALHRNVV